MCHTIYRTPHDVHPRAVLDRACGGKHLTSLVCQREISSHSSKKNRNALVCQLQLGTSQVLIRYKCGLGRIRVQFQPRLADVLVGRPVCLLTRSGAVSNHVAAGASRVACVPADIAEVNFRSAGRHFCFCLGPLDEQPCTQCLTTIPAVFRNFQKWCVLGNVCWTISI